MEPAVRAPVSTGGLPGGGPTRSAAGGGGAAGPAVPAVPYGRGFPGGAPLAWACGVGRRPGFSPGAAAAGGVPGGVCGGANGYGCRRCAGTRRSTVGSLSRTTGPATRMPLTSAYLRTIAMRSASPCRS